MSEQRSEGARSFSHLIATVGDGDLHADLSDAMNRLTRILKATAQERDSSASGRIVLTLDIEVDKKGVAEVEGSYTVKEPRARRHTVRALYVTAGGNLTAEDPRQQKLPMRSIATGTSEASRDVARGGE